MKPEPESFADVYNDTKDDQTIRSFLTNARIWISGWHLKKDEDDMAWCSASPIQGRSITHVKLCSAASAFDVADDKAGGTTPKPWTHQECSILWEISLSSTAGFSVSTYRFLSHELTPYLALFRNGTGPGPPFSPFGGEAKQLVLVDLFLCSPPRAYFSSETNDLLAAFQS